MSSSSRLQVIDSHTAGEPTRVVIAGGPTIPSLGAKEARRYLAEEADWMRCALIHEPRGFEAIVGAFLCEPSEADCVAAVVFFNNEGYLHGCLHGSMGVIETLAHLGKISAGTHRLETPVGVIEAHLQSDGQVTIHNVPSYRYLTNAEVEVPNYGLISGQVAWAGNWFFLLENQGPVVSQANIDSLTDFTSAVRDALDASPLRGKDGGLIDHIETFGTPEAGVQADSQNFVLCPGKAYDRSPCGTGTSAKIACLAAQGLLAEGEQFVQAGILGSSFKVTYRRLDEEQIIPIVTGRAYITAVSEFLFQEDDPYRYGVKINH